MGTDLSFSRREFDLLRHYHDPTSPGYGNGVRSAALAGFKGSPSTLAVQASRTLRKARQRGMLASALKKYECTFEHIAQCLSRCMRAQRKRAFMTKGGTIVYAELGDDCQVQLTAAKLLAPLLGVFDSKRQQESLLADVADAIAPAELAPPVEETSTEVGFDDKRSDQAGNKNSLPEEAQAPSDAASECASTSTSPRPDTTSVLSKTDGSDVAGQIDPGSVLVQLLRDALLEQQRAPDATERAKLRAEIVRIALALHKVRSGSAVNEDTGDGEAWDDGLAQQPEAANAPPAMVAEALANLPAPEYYATLKATELVSEFIDAKTQVDEPKAGSSPGASCTPSKGGFDDC